MRKKICMIVYSKYSIDARVRREAETLLRECNFEITVLTPKENTKPRTYKVDGVVVKELGTQKYYGENGFKYLTSYMNFLWRSALACTSLFIRGKIDIVHVHNMPNFLVFSAVLPRIFGKKVILDIHDTVPETFLSKFGDETGLAFKLLCLEEKVSCSLAHKIICVNHVQGDVLIKRGVPEEKMTISMNVPDHTRFPLSEAVTMERAKEKRFRMVYHGTIAKRLGIDLAILAVSKAVNEIPELELNIWGKGEFLDECAEISRDLGVARRVNFRGILPLDTIREAVKEMDVGIVANRRNAATELMLPVKMLEYIAIGIPVIVPKTEAIKYYFSEDMVTFFEPEDIDSMASAILEIYKDRLLGKRRAERAKGFLEKYGWENHQTELINLYKDLLGEALC